MTSFFRKLRWLSERRRKEEELQEELAFHLSEEAGERQSAGLPPDAAHYASRRELGSLALVQETTRAAWTWTFLEQFLQDLRYAARTLNRNRVFNALAVLSLALGIGANTAIYSFMDSLLIRQLPVPDPQTLATLNWHMKGRTRGSVMHGGSGTTWGDKATGTTAGIFPYPAFELFRKSDVFSSVFAYYPTYKVHMQVKEQAELAAGEFVSGDYFRGLAVAPAAGRPLGPDDDRIGAPPVAVVSFHFAQKHFDSAGAAPGQTILINHTPFVVAGVAAPGFFGVDPAAAPDFYIPLHSNVLLRMRSGPSEESEYIERNYYWLEMMGRLRPGVTRAQAQAALGPVFHQWAGSTAVNDSERADLPVLQIDEGLHGLNTLRREYSQPLYVLLIMVGLILAIACANIANLLLARAAARRREMAVRLSMGAGRFRVIRQLLTESLLLASLGGALGVALAVAGMRFLTVLLANGDADFTLHPELNWHVLAVASALSVLTGLLFGLAPALQATRADVMPALKESRTGQPAARRSFWRPGVSRVLVVTQIAMSLLMLFAAGLFVRTLSNLQSIELGFNRENLLLFHLNARQAGHRDPEIISFYTDLQKKFAAIPGVRGASASHHPLLGQGTWMGGVVPVGSRPLKDDVTTHILMTGSDFFATMKIPILLGRALDERDRAGAPQTVVVNQAYVQTNFGNLNPIGRHLVIGRRKPFGDSDVEIVGVAANARYGALRGDFREVVYVPFSQGSYYPVEDMFFAMRTAGDPRRFIPSIREIVHRADSHVPVTGIETEAAQLDRIMNQQIIFARLCSGFAILALLIACVGLYGTMAYTVARRTGEIGIRMALGARRASVVWLVLREVIAMAAVGLALSVPAAFTGSKLLQSFLFGVKHDDPRALTFSIVVLLTAALLAGYVPARRASRIDPMVALRHE